MRYRDISVEEAHRALGAARFVDVREAHELASDGFIAGVEHVPLAAVDAACVDWDRDRDLVLVCRSGARSGRAAQALARRGFHKVMNMAGGMLAYKAAGFPVAYR